MEGREEEGEEGGRAMQDVRCGKTDMKVVDVREGDGRDAGDRGRGKGKT